MKTHIIQLDRHDDATSVIDKLHWSKANRVLLVWPKRGRVLTGLLDLVLIQRACQNIGAQLACVVEDEDILDHSQYLGIPVFQSARIAEKIPWRRTRTKKGFEPRLFHPVGFFEEKKAGFLIKTAGYWENKVVRWPIFALGVAAVLVMILFLLPTAEVRLALAVEAQSVDMQVWASSDLRAINLSGGIPAKTLDTIVEGKGATKTTGSIILPDRSATGLVQFTNLTDQRVTIPAGTMLQTIAEPAIQFRTLREVELDALPGSQVEAGVQAVQAGSQGNIRSGEIQAVIGTLGTQVSVTNPSAILGGSDYSNPAATKSDLDRLREEITQQLYDSVLQDFFGAKDSGSILLTQTIKLVKIQEEIVEPAFGLPADQIEMTLRVEYQALMYREADLEAVAHAALDAKRDPGKNPLPGSIHIAEISPPVYENDQVRWKVNVSQLAQAAWDSSELIKKIAGQTTTSAIQNLEKFPGLTEPPQITLSPAWWPVVPLLPGRIEVEVR